MQIIDYCRLPCPARSSVHRGNGRIINDPSLPRKNRASRQKYSDKGMDKILHLSRASPDFPSITRLHFSDSPLGITNPVRNASPRHFHHSYKTSQTMDWSTNLPLILLGHLPKRVIEWMPMSCGLIRFRRQSPRYSGHRHG